MEKAGEAPGSGTGGPCSQARPGSSSLNSLNSSWFSWSAIGQKDAQGGEQQPGRERRADRRRTFNVLHERAALVTLPAVFRLATPLATPLARTYLAGRRVEGERVRLIGCWTHCTFPTPQAFAGQPFWLSGLLACWLAGWLAGPGCGSCVFVCCGWRDTGGRPTAPAASCIPTKPSQPTQPTSARPATSGLSAGPSSRISPEQQSPHSRDGAR